MQKQHEAAAMRMELNKERNVQFPERHFDGYWLFGAINGHPEFEAFKIGFNIGGFNGYDWGVKNIPADPNFCWYEITLIGRESKTTFVDMPIQRHEFDFEPHHLDIRLGDRFNVNAEWPYVNWYMASPDKNIIVQFKAETNIAHYGKNTVHKYTSWSMRHHPDFSYSGKITIDGVSHDFNGIGTIDHSKGVLFPSPTSQGVGYWEYDAFMIDDAYGLCELMLVDGAGRISGNEGATNYPDGNYHKGALEMEFTKFEQRGTVSMPREWKCKLVCDHGTLTYTVKGVGQHWDGVPHSLGDGFPNLLLLIEGEFVSNDGARRTFSGKGTGEFMLSEWNPETNSKYRPW